MADGHTTPLTSDRYDSYSPAWSRDGKWIYFLSDRHFQSVVGSPWGARQPEPFFDKQTKVYQVALRKGERSPFKPDDELAPDVPSPSPPAKDGSAAASAGETKPATPRPPVVNIDLEGILQRLIEVPVAPDLSGAEQRATHQA